MTTLENLNAPSVSAVTTLDRRTLLVGAAAMLAMPIFPAEAQSALGTPFRFRASDDALNDLKRRLAATRWPEPATEPGFAQGPPLNQMRELIDYWQTRYDWRRTEARLASWPQFKSEIDGLGIHYLHVRSRHAAAQPIVLTHGWPSTILLFQDVIAPLTDPTAHGGAASEAFHVVIPSLPGFGFSDRPTAPGWNAARTARAWGTLMRQLGYTRYVAQGGDWGAFVTTAMAQQRVPGLEAVHLNFAQTIPDRIPSRLLPDQKKAVDAYRKWKETGAYAMLQRFKPQLAGYLLADSPSAQAAWLYDIFDSGSGNTGHPENMLPIDHMLDEITLFWLTGTAASSARIYREQAALLGNHNNPGRIDLPVGVSMFPNDLPAARSWAHLVYQNLFYWNEPSRGGHFIQMEAPDLFVAELRNAFRAWREHRRA